MIPIRANANTVINENSPSDARLLLAYYNLEQYPETKLFYGPMFSDAYAGQDPDEPYIDDKPKYERDYTTGKYKIHIISCVFTAPKTREKSIVRAVGIKTSIFPEVYNFLSNPPIAPIPN